MRRKKLMSLALLGGALLSGYVSINAASLMSSHSLSLKCYVLPILADKTSATTCYGKGGDNVENYEASVGLVVTDTSNKKVYDKETTRTGWDAVSGEGKKGLCQLSYSHRQIKKAASTHKGKKNKNSSSWDETYSQSKSRT